MNAGALTVSKLAATAVGVAAAGHAGLWLGYVPSLLAISGLSDLLKGVASNYAYDNVRELLRDTSRTPPLQSVITVALRSALLSLHRQLCNAPEIGECNSWFNAWEQRLSKGVAISQTSLEALDNLFLKNDVPDDSNLEAMCFTLLERLDFEHRIATNAALSVAPPSITARTLPAFLRVHLRQYLPDLIEQQLVLALSESSNRAVWIAVQRQFHYDSTRWQQRLESHLSTLATGQQDVLDRLDALYERLSGTQQTDDLLRLELEKQEWITKFRTLERDFLALRYDLHRNAARERLVQGHPEEAARMLDTAIVRSGQSITEIANLHFDRARLYELAFDFPNATASYQTAHQLLPTNTDILIHLAVALERVSSFSEARAHYQTVLKTVDPETGTVHRDEQGHIATALNNLGLLALVAENVVEARDYFTRAFKIMGDEEPERRAITLLNLGLTSVQSLDFRSATTYDQAALVLLKPLHKHAPNRYGMLYALALSNFATVLKTCGQEEEAADALTAACAIQRTTDLANNAPAALEFIKSLMNLGNLYSDQGIFDRAEAAYREALDLTAKHRAFHPSSFDQIFCMVSFNYGNWHARRGDYEHAERAYIQALERQNEDVSEDKRAISSQAVVHSALATLYRETNNPTAAAASIDRAIALFRSLRDLHQDHSWLPRLVECLATRADLQGNHGAFQDAHDSYREAVDESWNAAEHYPMCYPMLIDTIGRWADLLMRNEKCQDAARCLEDAIYVGRELLKRSQSFAETLARPLIEAAACYLAGNLLATASSRASEAMEVLSCPDGLPTYGSTAHHLFLKAASIKLSALLYEGAPDQQLVSSLATLIKDQSPDPVQRTLMSRLLGGSTLSVDGQ